MAGLPRQGRRPIARGLCCLGLQRSRSVRRETSGGCGGVGVGMVGRGNSHLMIPGTGLHGKRRVRELRRGERCDRAGVDGSVSVSTFPICLVPAARPGGQARRRLICQGASWSSEESCIRTDGTNRESRTEACVSCRGWGGVVLWLGRACGGCAERVCCAGVVLSCGCIAVTGHAVAPHAGRRDVAATWCPGKCERPAAPRQAAAGVPSMSRR